MDAGLYAIKQRYSQLNNERRDGYSKLNNEGNYDIRNVIMNVVMDIRI
jgi:hypothetical protein